MESGAVSAKGAVQHDDDIDAALARIHERHEASYEGMSEAAAHDWARLDRADLVVIGTGGPSILAIEEIEEKAAVLVAENVQRFPGYKQGMESLVPDGKAFLEEANSIALRVAARNKTPSLRGVTDQIDAMLDTPYSQLCAMPATGVTMIDEKFVDEVQWAEKIGPSDGRRYELLFLREQNVIATLADLDEHDLLDALGETNAGRIENAEDRAGTLSGETLSKEYGLTPAESRRRRYEKEIRKGEGTTPKQVAVLRYLAENGIRDAVFHTPTELRVYHWQNCGLQELAERAGISVGEGGQTPVFAYATVDPELFDHSKLANDLDQGEGANGSKSEETFAITVLLNVRAADRSAAAAEAHEFLAYADEAANDDQVIQSFDVQGADRAQLATKFMDELLESVETLGAIAEQHGVRTLTDLMYMQSSILKDGYIDHHPGESAVLKVVLSLPSSETWLRYVHIDAPGLAKSAAAASSPSDPSPEM